MIRIAGLLLLASAHALAANGFDAEVAARRAEAKRLAGRAEAIVPLLGILDGWALADDRGAIAAALDEVRADRRQRFEVRARATYLASIVAERMGDRARGQALRGELGLLGQWQVVGPFDNEGKSGHERVYGPEKELSGRVDPARGYPASIGGVQREVTWRRLAPERLAQGMVPLDAALKPDSHVTAYATTYIKVGAPVRAALRLGSTGALKAWVDGRQVFARDVYRPVRIDQEAAPIALAAGWSRITVKVSAAEAGWAFFARVTALDGSPIPFEQSADGGPDAGARRSPPPGAGTVASLGADLQRAAKGGSADALRALGIYLHYVAPDDPERKGAEQALKRSAERKPSTEALRLEAMATAEPNARRRKLEQAIAPQLAAKATPFQRARVDGELGEHYARAHRERRAEELWRAAERADPDYFPAALKLAELAADRGLPSLGLEQAKAVAARHPALAAKQLVAQLADRSGREGEARAELEAIVRGNAEDLGALRELFGYARARGDVAAALALLDQMARARPDLVSIAIDRAELLDGVGRTADAERGIAEALAASPDDPRLTERDGKLLHRMGHDAEARERFRRTLELKPQSPDLRAYLAKLEEKGARPAPGAGDDLQREFAEAVPKLIARAGRPSGAASARVLRDCAATRVHANGLSETFTQRVVQVLDARGARELSDEEIRFTPDTQSIDVKAARVYKPSGEIVEAASQADRDLSEPWYGIYYDVKAEVIQLPRLEPGDVIDLEYVVSDVGRRNLFADYFGELHLLQEELPRDESVYVLIAPKARPLYFNQPKLAGLEHSEQDRGDERVYRFRARNVPKVEAEPGMPGFTDVAAYVHVSTYRTWEEVATWYQGLVRDQLQPDEAIEQAVADATRGLTDERARIQAIFDLVVKKTRYVGLEFGIHGYKPYKVAQIFQRKFGDCKDKASLLKVMLGLAHVDATLVLARTRHGGDLDAYPASLAPFDHAIVFVPKYGLYLDGTAEFSGSAELPAQDQDIPVLLVSDPREGGKGHLARTPVLPPDKNRVSRALDVTLQSSGAAKVELQMSVAGEAAHEWRSHYQTAGERRERFEKAENGAHPGAKVLKVDLPTIDDLEKPVEVRGELEVPSWARASGTGDDRAGPRELAMPALGREGELLRSYARLSERQHDLVLGYPWQQDERVRIVMPRGFSPKRLPEARRIDTPFGSFAVTVSQRGRDVELQTALTVKRHRIGRGEYPAFRKFCLDVDAAVGQELVLSRE